jgi:drug/metabolite transporter (DMT)-like permease
MVPLAIFSKLLADSLISLYPTIVKNINIPIGLQLWTRFFTYTGVSFFLVDWRFIYNELFSGMGIMLSLITIINVYCLYRGFLLLEGGLSYALYYTYPFMILLFSGEKPGIAMCMAIIGILILYKSHHNQAVENESDKVKDKEENSEEKENSKEKENGKDNNSKPTAAPNAFQEITKKLAEKFEYVIFPSKKVEGYFMILLAALSQAAIYFLIRKIKTKNHWNHLFLSYYFGALLFTLYYFQEIQTFGVVSHLSLSLLLNICVGLAGYILRFYAIYRLPPTIYAPLSYFGVVTANLYGILFNAEKVTNLKILGISCILLSNVVAIIK